MNYISKSSCVIIFCLLIPAGHACKKDKVLLPTVTTFRITDISNITAISGGNVLNDGGSSIVSKGVCWNITGNPTITDSKTSNGTGTGSYISDLTALQPGTTYFVKSYAGNNLGTAYGNELSFTTTQSAIVSEFRIKNLDPPSESYIIREGNCGEAVLWTICQYFGKQLSQEQINYIGGNPGRGLHGDEVIKVLDSLKIPFNLREKADSWESTVDTLKNIIIRGNPIIVGVKIYPDLHPEWYADHFILFTGTNTLYKVFYYNSICDSYSITYEELCGTGNGYSLVNKYNLLYAVEILLPH
jgi:hypothetical protein